MKTYNYCVTAVYEFSNIKSCGSVFTSHSFNNALTPTPQPSEQTSYNLRLTIGVLASTVVLLVLLLVVAGSALGYAYCIKPKVEPFQPNCAYRRPSTSYIQYPGFSPSGDDNNILPSYESISDPPLRSRIEAININMVTNQHYETGESLNPDTIYDVIGPKPDQDVKQ